MSNHRNDKRQSDAPDVVAKNTNPVNAKRTLTLDEFKRADRRLVKASTVGERIIHLYRCPSVGMTIEVVITDDDSATFYYLDQDEKAGFAHCYNSAEEAYSRLAAHGEG